MRSLAPVTRLALVAAAWSCASAGFPPGGPEDFEPPTIVRVRPDTNATNVRANAITFDFGEVVSERPQGASELSGLFLISPSHGTPRLSWRRTTISVSPRGGFRPNTTYSVRLLPGITDLENNVDSAGATIVFSTGPSLASGNIRGIVFDWPAEKPGAQALVEAFPLPTDRDSTRYLTIADSLGRFDLAHLPPGRYLLRGMIDQNRNRLLDPRELFDTTTVALTDSLRHEILAYVHDTLGAGIQTVTITDSLTLRVTMDRLLDTAFVIDSSRFRLQRSDSSLLPIARALSRRDDDRRKEDSVRTRALEDSIRRAAERDSAAARDTAAAAAPPPPPPATRRVPPPRRPVPEAAQAPAREDTTDREPPPTPSVPAPVSEVILHLAEPLRPASSYRLQAIEMRTLLQRTRTSDRVFTTPRERRQPDSTARRAASDSAARDTTRRDSTVRDTTAVDTAAVDTTTVDTTVMQPATHVAAASAAPAALGRVAHRGSGGPPLPRRRAADGDPMRAARRQGLPRRG